MARKSIHKFETSSGGGVYQIPVEVFPKFWGFVYLVIFEDYRVLIDAGSGIGESNELLEAGLIESGQNVSLQDLTHVFITHGHIDHFGGLTYIIPKTNALIGVHELDLRNLINYEERAVTIAHSLENYMKRAGVNQNTRENLLGLYRFTKELGHSVPVDFTYEGEDLCLGPFKFLHVPGHSAGHVVIRLHDILFCGDHILSDISPHQSPEHITMSTGLSHYLHSLDALENWTDGINLALCGHQDTISDLPGRINEIRVLHQERLEKVMEFFRVPGTILELSKSLFGRAIGYNALLALEEAGAHVEYLYQRGNLGIKNLEELEAIKEPVALYYQRL
jgi:glyoxylase-like metal-dependent hydrolase (beta-lactamase superfamily II)